MFPLIKVLHLNRNGAHFGQNGFVRSLETHFYIKGFEKIVEELVKVHILSRVYPIKKKNRTKFLQKLEWDVRWFIWATHQINHHVTLLQRLLDSPMQCHLSQFSKPRIMLLESDNRTPFKSQEMLNLLLTWCRGNHPSENNVETVMKPLEKAVKIGYMHYTNKAENIKILPIYLQVFFCSRSCVI